MAITQFEKDSTIQQINDSRLPSTLGTAGQVLKMNDAATAIEWGSAGGSGSSKYFHKIFWWYNSLRMCINIEIITTSATPFTYSSLDQWLRDNEYITKPYPTAGYSCAYGDGYPVVGIFSGTAYSSTYTGIGIYYTTDATKLYYGNGSSDMHMIDTGNYSAYYTFTDTVIEL